MEKGENLVCRTCLVRLNNWEHYDENYAVNKDCKTIKEQLMLCFPDLNLEMTSKYVLCIVCVKRLSIAYKYFKICMEAEYNIHRCIKNGVVPHDSDWASFSKVLTNERLINSDLVEHSQLDSIAGRVDKTPVPLSYSRNQKVSVNVCNTTDSLIRPVLPCQVETSKVVEVSNENDASSLNPVAYIPEVISLINEDTDEDVVFIKSTRSNKTEYFCSTCKKVYFTNNHVCQSLEANKSKCPTCNVTFPNDTILNFHMLQHKAKKVRNNKTRIKSYSCEKRFKCPKCSLTFKFHNGVSSHFIASHIEQRNIFTCDWCNYNSHVLAEFKQHIEQHFKYTKLYKCNKCILSYTSKTMFDNHRCSHLTCFKCGERFKFVETIQKHMEICTGEKSVGDICDITTNSVNLGHSCSVCKGFFTTTSDLDIHKSLHHKEIFMCNLCNQKYSSSNDLLVHTQTCNNYYEYSNETLVPEQMQEYEWINYDEQPVLQK